VLTLTKFLKKYVKSISEMSTGMETKVLSSEDPSENTLSIDNLSIDSPSENNLSIDNLSIDNPSENTLSIDSLTSIFRDAREAFTPTAQVILSFAVGVLLSPWSWGLIFYILFLVVYEIVYYFFTDNWDEYSRMAVIVYAILGWIIGREFYHLFVLDPECEEKDRHGLFWRLFK
jgi:hypothetical protein